MHDQVGTFIRCFFVGVFLITLLAGVYLWKNDERFFGVTDEVPSESDGARGYNRTQIWAVWAHVAFFSALFALCIH